MSKLINNFIHKINVACDASDDMRPCYGYVFFRDGYAYASNARILVRTPLAELLRLPEDGGAPELLNGYCVHTRTLNRIMKHDEIKLLPNGVITATDKGTTITYQLTLENTGEAPKGPNFESVLTPPEERTPVKNIGLNARFLATLAEAMGVPDNIKMNFTTANRAIFIEPTDETNHSIGVIMPINLQPSLPGFGDEGDDEEPTNE